MSGKYVRYPSRVSSWGAKRSAWGKVWNTTQRRPRGRPAPGRAPPVFRRGSPARDRAPAWPGVSLVFDRTSAKFEPPQVLNHCIFTTETGLPRSVPLIVLIEIRTVKKSRMQTGTRSFAGHSATAGRRRPSGQPGGGFLTHARASRARRSRNVVGGIYEVPIFVSETSPEYPKPHPSED